MCQSVFACMCGVYLCMCVCVCLYVYLLYPMEVVACVCCVSCCEWCCVRPLLDGQVVGLVQHVPSQGEAVIRPPLDLGGENWGTSKAGLGVWRSKGSGDQGDDGGGAVHGEGVPRGSGCGMMCGMMSATGFEVWILTHHLN